MTDGLVFIKWVIDRELDLLKSEVFNGDVFEVFDVWACLPFCSYSLLVWGVVVDRPPPPGTYYDFFVETIFEQD